MQNKILGIAKNFSPLPKNKIVKDYPVIFNKPWSTLQKIDVDNKVRIRSDLNIMYEFELGVLISKECRKVDAKNYLDYIGGYFLCLDMTEVSKVPLFNKDGGTWTLSKSLDNSTPIGSFIEKDLIDPKNVVLELVKNGKRIQLGNTKDFTYTVDEQIEIISYYTTLYPGDLILTGFFSTVDLVTFGDNIEGNLYTKFDYSKEEKLNVKDYNLEKGESYFSSKPCFSMKCTIGSEFKQQTKY